jgi:hypothetical protein
MLQPRCPLCGKRPAGRDCPAKAARICSVCCGTKREVEIDCPGDCVYLTSGRAWEAGRAESAPPPRALRFGEQFVSRHGPVITELARAVLDERAASPGLVDADVRATLEALRATVRTLDSGLYYETRPEGSFAATALYQRMKAVLDGCLEDRQPNLPLLKVSEAGGIMEFLLEVEALHGSDRPRSRRFLDWLRRATPSRSDSEATSRLIVP